MNPFARLPSVTRVLDAVGEISFPRAAVVTAIRNDLAAVRHDLAEGRSTDYTPPAVAARVRLTLAGDAVPKLRRVINATGIVLHTNLGRAPLSEAAARAAYEAGRGYLNLELDLETGKRGKRPDAVRDGIRRITGAAAATVVNNCAAATVIVLRALAAGKEVIISRGQLVEIGGGFRIPDILRTSGATLREVGTTNITRVGDYAAAIGPDTGLIMRVHTSNFRVRGYTRTVEIADLAALGKAHNIPVIDDAGSGAALDFAKLGFPGEPGVAAGLAAGADLVLFSGDKLLGGPQSGVIAGREDLIAKIEADPLMRAFRVDKLTLAALAATLAAYRDPAAALHELPALRMLTTPVAELRTRAAQFAVRLAELPGFAVAVRADTAFAGGGSLPDQSFETVLVGGRLTDRSAADFARRLRRGTPAVITRVQDDAVWFDLRAVFDREEDELFDAIRTAAAHHPTPGAESS